MKRLSAEKFREIYSMVTRLCVEVLVVKDGKLLLTKRAIEPYLGMWHFPGGTVMYGELLEETVRRKAAEELGIEVVIDRMLGYLEYPEMAKLSDGGWAIGVVFKTRWISGDIKLNNEAVEFGWYDTVPENMIAVQSNFMKKNEWK